MKRSRSMFVLAETGNHWTVFVGGVAVFTGSHRDCKRFVAAQEWLSAA